MSVLEAVLIGFFMGVVFGFALENRVSSNLE